MQKLKIINQSENQAAWLTVSLYTGFWEKFRGLMFMEQIGPNDGILIDQGKDSRINAAIHMLFMRFKIAVIWISSEKTIVDKTIAKPWRLAYVPVKPARYILETDAKYAEHYKQGDRLDFYYE